VSASGQERTLSCFIVNDAEVKVWFVWLLGFGCLIRRGKRYFSQGLAFFLLLSLVALIFVRAFWVPIHPHPVCVAYTTPIRR